MDILHAIILGIVQGITEFVPVSSSGHLTLLQKVFGIEMPGLFFDTMLHAGTLIAVFVVFWKDIWVLLKKIVQPLTGFLILGTIPVIIAVLLFMRVIEHAFETGQFLGFSLLLTSALLFFADKLSKRTDTNLKKEKDMKWYDAVFIGTMQAIAVLPGVSRSGATISGALFRKLDRDFAARFSFLLSIPAILAAFIMHAIDLIRGGTAAEAAVERAGALTIIIGTLTAAAVGFFAIKFMLKIIRERSLYGFAIYTGILGTLVLVDQFVTHIIF